MTTVLSDIDFNELKKIKQELHVMGHRLSCIIDEETWRRAKEKMSVDDGKQC